LVGVIGLRQETGTVTGRMLFNRLVGLRTLELGIKSISLDGGFVLEGIRQHMLLDNVGVSEAEYFLGKCYRSYLFQVQN